MHALARILIGLAFVQLALVSSAQTVSPDAERREADAQWKALLERRLPEHARLVPGEFKPESERSGDRTRSAAHFAAIAAEARAFRERYPHHDRASESRALEAGSLIKAALLGDAGAASRYPELVEAVRKDTRLLSPQRFEVVALAELQMIRGLPRDRTDLVAARENSARYLISEFPGEAGGYVALLSAADALADGSRVQAAVREVINSPAPFAAKAMAQVLQQRYELIGLSLADVTSTVLGRDNLFEKSRGRQAVVYSWATWSRPSMEFARGIVRGLPEEVLVFGVNLDHDVAAAKAVAEREGLPGEQVYHEAGIGSLMALRLKLNAAPLLYVTDAAGVIRDVTAHREDPAERVKVAASIRTQR